jgi:hypothetical protein
VSKSCSYVLLNESNPLPPLNIDGQWGAVIVAEMEFSQSRQNAVADWLYSAHCRYMAAWGIGCSSWDDALDWAEIDFHPDGASDDQFIMTTWHENEALDEVFWFIGTIANTYDDLPLSHILICHLADNDREVELLEQFAKASAA